ncbi:MAG: putative Type pilus pilin [Parcubacteria group bacterium]|nr:putative Type pilus pilin [Parcubacteria group bacterium]
MTMHPRRSGFTLIEMIVSVGLFAMVMLIATGAYLSLISLDRKARATNDLVTNLNFTIDTMERSLRSGSNYQSGGIGGGNSGPEGASGIAFVNDQGQTVTYTYNPYSHSMGQCVGTGSTCSGSSVQQLTDPRVAITNMKFYVRGVGSGDTLQPWVTFTVTGTLTPDSTSAPITFTIQSTAAQRAIEL